MPFYRMIKLFKHFFTIFSVTLLREFILYHIFVSSIPKQFLFRRSKLSKGCKHLDSITIGISHITLINSKNINCTITVIFSSTRKIKRDQRVCRYIE